jgi:hypothetical protein
MKKFTTFLFVAALSIIITSCHFGRHTRIIENGNGHYLSIESYGKVYFNRAGTDIAYISRGGYLNYRNDNKELRAENDNHGGIKYELMEDGQKLEPNSNDRAFIADAVKIMMAKGYHSN